MDQPGGHGSDRDEFPIGGARTAVPTALLYVSHVGNAGRHVSWAVRHRRWDPGSVTAVATLHPVAVSGLIRLARDPAVSRRALGGGIAGGVAVSAGPMPLLKRRLRRGVDR